MSKIKDFAKKSKSVPVKVYNNGRQSWSRDDKELAHSTVKNKLQTAIKHVGKWARPVASTAGAVIAGAAGNVPVALSFLF